MDFSFSPKVRELQARVAGGPALGSEHFEKALGDLASESEAPHLSREFIDKCLDDMRRLGLISAPNVQ